MIWFIHFVTWTEIKENKRQHLMVYIHVLVISQNCFIYLMLSSPSPLLLLSPFFMSSPSPSPSLSPSLSLCTYLHDMPLGGASFNISSQIDLIFLFIFFGFRSDRGKIQFLISWLFISFFYCANCNDCANVVIWRSCRHLAQLLAFGITLGAVSAVSAVSAISAVGS